MTTRRGFLGKLVGLAVAGPLAKKVELPKTDHATSGFLGPGGKLVDDGTLLQTVYGIERGIAPPRLVPCYPQNVGMISEGGLMPAIRQPLYPVSLWNPTSEPVTEMYGGRPVTVGPKQRVRVTERDLYTVDQAHDEALVWDRYGDLQPEEPEFYEDDYGEDDDAD